MALSTNVPDKPMSSSRTVTLSPLKDQAKSGSISTQRDKPAKKG